MTATRAIRGLGEIALRVADLDRMQAFYEGVIGLQLLRRFPPSAFFRIAGGVARRHQCLALVDRTADPGYQGLSSAHTTVDRLAFAIALEDFASEKARLAAAGLRVETAEHAWVHWRWLYVNDPEGSRV